MDLGPLHVSGNIACVIAVFGASRARVAAPALTLDEVADQAGAGADVRKYLKLRGLTSPCTLAMVAPDEPTFRDVMIAPLLSGFSVGSDSVQLIEADKPIAAAVLLYMRKLAIEHEKKPNPGGKQPLGTAAQNPAAPTSAATTDMDKVPRTLPPGVWAAQVAKYEAIQIDVETRKFSQNMVLGAEASMAKLWHALKVSRNFTPLPLGELIAKRSFDAANFVNGLSKRKQSKELVVDLDKDRLVAEDTGDTWEPRSMLLVIDALQALRWAYTVLGYGHELHIQEIFELLILRARQRPDNFRANYEAASRASVQRDESWQDLERSIRCSQRWPPAVSGDHDSAPASEDPVAHQAAQA